MSFVLDILRGSVPRRAGTAGGHRESADYAIISKVARWHHPVMEAGAERIFGYTPGETVGQPITLLFPGANGRGASDPGPVAARERLSISRLCEWPRTGRRIDISLTVSPV